MAANRLALIEELKRRKLESEKPKFVFEHFCFDKQIQFFRSPGLRFRTAVCSRRAGKTVGIAADMIDKCLNKKDIYCLYLTLTSESAREIIWGDIKRIIEDYELKVKTNEVRMSVDFLETKSKIRIAGVKDRSEIEKYRGRKVISAYIDECQSFRPYIKELIKDVLIPTLRDNRGDLYLTGTPGPVPAGPFYEYSHSEEWNNFKWTAFENPHMHNPPKKDLEITLAEERNLFNIDVSDPSYQRETYGRWIEDTDSLVFKFNKVRNSYVSLPTTHSFNYIFGIDIGFNDADAIAVLAYHPEHNNVYLVEEKLTSKQGITELVNQIKALQQTYKPVKMVMDAGALGKKIQEEIIQRHGLVIEAAEKTRKNEFIELLNDDLRLGKFKSVQNSAFAEDCMLVQWDLESRIKNPEKPKVSSTYHSDICDAVLYAWRECKHYIDYKPERKHRLGTDEYMEKLERKEAEKLKLRLEDPDSAFYDDMFEQDFNDLDDW